MLSPTKSIGAVGVDELVDTVCGNKLVVPVADEELVGLSRLTLVESCALVPVGSGFLHPLRSPSDESWGFLLAFGGGFG